MNRFTLQINWFSETEWKMVTDPSSLQTWKHSAPEEQEPALSPTHPPNTWCLSVSGAGMSPADPAGDTLRCLCWLCGSFSWLLLYSSIPSSEPAGSCVWVQVLSSRASCLCRCPVWSALTAVWSSARACCWCKGLGDLSWPRAGIVFMSSEKQKLWQHQRAWSGWAQARPVSSKLSHWDLSSSPRSEQLFLLAGQWKWETLGLKMTEFRKNTAADTWRCVRMIMGSRNGLSSGKVPPGRGCWSSWWSGRWV